MPSGPPAPTLAPPAPAPTLAPSVPAAKPPGGFETAGLPPQAPGRTAQIERYIAQYKGGDCFLITPNSIGANTARIDGYGRDQAAFEILDDAFKQANGFEADIEVRQVTAPQCPALTFLARLRAERGNGPRLQIGETNLKSGQALTGSIEGVGNDNVQLLLVSDEGAGAGPVAAAQAGRRRADLQSAHAARRRAGRAAATAARRHAARGRSKRCKDAKSPADQLFPLAQVEVTRTGQSVGAAVRYFKLDRPDAMPKDQHATRLRPHQLSGASVRRDPSGSSRHARHRSSAWTRHRSIPAACWSSAAATARISFRSRFSGRRANSSGWT